MEPTEYSDADCAAGVSLCFGWWNRWEDITNNDVTIRLTADQALVLSDWLSRLEEDDRIDVEAVWTVIGALDKRVAAIFAWLCRSGCGR